MDPSALNLGDTNVEELSYSQLGIAVLRIWSRILSGNLMWPVIRHISHAFEILAQRSAKETLQASHSMSLS